MQELCQMCEGAAATRKDRDFGSVCNVCYEEMKWERWHEGITPVRAKD